MVPYADPATRREYGRRYNKIWDTANKEKRQEYKYRYRRPDLRHCMHCQELHSDRRWKCPSCGISAKGPRAPRKSQALAPVGTCPICLCMAKLVRDHDHKTGLHRGLICDGCNRGLGFFRDSPLFLRGAIVYLKKARP